MATGKVSVLICLFPYGHVLDDRTATWLFKLRQNLEQDKRISGYALWQESDTPITHLRNRALVDAESGGYDFALMIDSDNIPDLYVRSDPNAKPFFPSSLDFALDSVARRGLPTIIGAPYCGPSPHNCCYVFDWVNFRNPGLQPDGRDVRCDFALEMVPRHEAAERKGIQPAAALPTGVILIDMNAVKPLGHPRFDYEWSDARQIKKASTEDVYFTRNISYLWQDHGPVCFANWDAWAGHVKMEVVGKPQAYPNAWVPSHLVQQCREALKVGKPVPSGPGTAPHWAIRPVNSYAAPPKGYPVESIRLREPVAVPPEGEFPEDAAPEETGVLNGQAP